jgi:hypothetical protein
MNKVIVSILVGAVLSACALPQPVPEWAVDSCLRAHGTPVFTNDAFGNTEFRCIVNDGRNSLNARYFNDSDLIEGMQDTDNQ